MKQCRMDCIHAEACRRFADNNTYWNSGDCPIYKPTADVVPKSEVENLKVLLEMKDVAYEALRELYATDTAALVKAREKTEVEVAREIFDEIEEQIDRGLSVITKILNAKGGRDNGKTVLVSKYDVFIEAKKYIAELKKKHTEV